jgi:DNA-binding MarR family transcriptional regulator
MIIMDNVTITKGKTIPGAGTLAADVPGSRNIPHLTRLARRVYANAPPDVLGVTLKQLAILVSLRDRGELPQQMLCDVLHTTQNTVVVWLNELESAGFVLRIRDPEDRRKHNVAITAAGWKALERAEAELRRLEDEALAGLTADERAQLRKLLAKALEAGT